MYLASGQAFEVEKQKDQQLSVEELIAVSAERWEAFRQKAQMAQATASLSAEKTPSQTAESICQEELIHQLKRLLNPIGGSIN